MLLEQIINNTIIFYAQNDVGIFHKKNLDFKFRSIKRDGGKLIPTDAFITQKSTSDYYGIANGKFFAFEAKSTNSDKLPLSNIKNHQTDYLKKIKKHGGEAFFIIGFMKEQLFFRMDINKFSKIKKRSINIDDLNKSGSKLELTYPGIIDFL